MKKRILIVEDDHELRNVIKIFLEEAQFELYTSDNVKNALSLCAEKQPHAVIVDIYLNGELGLDITSAIAGDEYQYGKPKVIVMSGTVGGELVKSEAFLKENKIDLFIKKPFECPELIKKVSNLVN